MTAEWNSSNNRFELAGDGTGRQTLKASGIAKPNGVNQVLLFTKLAVVAGAVEENPSWDANMYSGWSFDGEHIDYPAVGEANCEAAFANFFGYALKNYDEAANLVSPAIAGASYQNTTDTWFTLDDAITDAGSLQGVEGFVADGLGGTLENYYVRGAGGPPEGGHFISSENLNALNFRCMCMPVGTSVGGWQVLQIRKSLLDDSVLLDAWFTTTDLEALGLENIPNSDPQSVMDVVVSSEDIVLTSDLTGTNWDDGAGNLNAPSFYLASWPFSAGMLAVSKVGMKYGTYIS